MDDVIQLPDLSTPASGTELQTPAPHLASREALLRELQLLRRRPLKDEEVFLIVINIADTKAYDEIIRIFGYKFADNMLSIRLENLDYLTGRTAVYEVGFWSVGMIYQPGPRENPQNFVETLVKHLGEPIICRGIAIPIRAGVGICDLNKGLGATEDLLQSTFIAGQSASRSRAGWTVCNYDVADDHRRAFSLISDIGYAMTASSEFEICYQGRIDLKASRCVGAEALLRWHHPRLGRVSPGEFLPLVEMTGLTKQMTNWVLSRAVMQAVQWHRMGIGLKISINVSARNLEEPDFVDRVIHTLKEFRLEPHFLELEVSESGVFTDTELVKTHLRALREAGISIAVDDFGTGANSLAYLQTIPADIMKIDSSLIIAMKDNLKGQAVVKSMILLAHNLGMTVVAEGVESRDILALLIGWGCDYAQGYFLGRPMYAADFDGWYMLNFPRGGMSSK